MSLTNFVLQPSTAKSLALLGKFSLKTIKSIDSSFTAKRVFSVFPTSTISISNAKPTLSCNLFVSKKGVSNTSIARPFEILGLQQIAIGSTDQKSINYLWHNILGLKKIGTFRSERENVDEVIMNLGPTESPYAVEVDLMVPLDETKSPKVHIPPLNHIGLWVDNLPAAVEWMSSKGVRFTPGGIRKGASGHDVSFIHPKSNEENAISGCGVLIELVQAPQNVIDVLRTQK